MLAQAAAEDCWQQAAQSCSAGRGPRGWQGLQVKSCPTTIATACCSLQGLIWQQPLLEAVRRWLLNQGTHCIQSLPAWAPSVHLERLRAMLCAAWRARGHPSTASTSIKTIRAGHCLCQLHLSRGLLPAAIWRAGRLHQLEATVAPSSSPQVCALPKDCGHPQSAE